MPLETKSFGKEMPLESSSFGKEILLEISSIKRASFEQNTSLLEAFPLPKELVFLSKEFVLKQNASLLEASPLPKVHAH